MYESIRGVGMSKLRVNIKNVEFPSDVVLFIEKELKALKVDKRLRLQAMLHAEEILVKLKEHATSDNIVVAVKKRMGDPHIEICMPGDEFDEKELVGGEEFGSLLDLDDDSESSIRAIILQAYGNRLVYKNRNKINNVSIAVGESSKKNVYYTVISLVLALLIGIICSAFVPQGINDTLCTYIFIPFKTMFVNALKMIVGPIIFFSIANCLAQFSDLKELGRIGAKVIGMYLCTTFFAIIIGLSTFYIFEPGTYGGIANGGIEPGVAEVVSETPSFIDTIVDIVPSNVINPFVESNTMQIIFLAAITGIAVGAIGTNAIIIKQLIEALNSLFLSIVTMISKLIPFAIFSSIFVIITETGLHSLVALLGLIGTFLVGIILMMLVYSLIILVIAHLSPIKFFKKNFPGMLTTFSLSSSNAAMPTNLDICENAMGISSQVCSFSIPLGATINMDGFCIYLTIAGLFLAKMFGIEVTSSSIATLILTVVMISISAPGIPGVSIVCLSVLLGVLGVPVEAIGLVMGIDALVDMVRTVSNTTGDIAVTLAVAKSENLVDIEKWK